MILGEFEMSQLFEKKDVNPTVRVVISMNQDEREVFKLFANKMNLPLSAFMRIACKNYIQGEGKKYVESQN